MKRLILLAFVSFFTLPAYAAPMADAAGATALKPRIQNALQQIATTIQANGIKLDMQGDLMVEAVDTYYAITTPALSLKMPSGTTRVLGMLAINAVPTDDPNILQIAAALPTPMIDIDQNGTRAGVISIGRQNMSGLWDLRAQTFTQLKASYQNIIKTNAKNAPTLKIGALAIDIALTQNNGLWSGPTNIAATNIASTTPLISNFKIARLDMSSKVQNADLGKRAAIIDQHKGDLSKPALSATPSILNALLKTFGDDMSSKTSLRGISLTSAIGQTTIEKLDLNSTLKKAQNITPATSMDLAITGIKNNGTIAPDMLPTRMMLRFTTSGMPLGNIPTTKQAFEDTLANSNLSFKLDNLFIDASAYGLLANGAYTHQKDTPKTSAFSIRMRGLDNLNAYLTAPETPIKVPTLALAVQTMQLLGKPSDDKTTLSYDFKMDKNGTVTLNGADISGLKKAIDKN